VKRQLLAAAAAMLLLAGCGGGESADAPGSSSQGTTAPSARPPNSMTDGQAPPEQLAIDVTIKGGKVTPTNEQLQAEVGEPIVVRVDSDATDELHVHSTPEHSFDVGIGPGQSFQFTVSVPGRVDIELHQLHATVATIQVR
jgi:ABC-type glycerol-3-phosphate transport system substrate-binding protein